MNKLINYELTRGPNGALKIYFSDMNKTIILGYIDDKDPSIINMVRVREVHLHRKLEGYGFNREFIDKAEEGGIKYVRLKLDVKKQGMRYVHLIPTLEIKKHGIPNVFKDYERQYFFKEAWMIEYLEYKHEKK
jgi:hypothetical protein